MWYRSLTPMRSKDQGHKQTKCDQKARHQLLSCYTENNNSIFICESTSDLNEKANMPHSFKDNLVHNSL